MLIREGLGEAADLVVKVTVRDKDGKTRLLRCQGKIRGKLKNLMFGNKTKINISKHCLTIYGNSETISSYLEAC